MKRIVILIDGTWNKEGTTGDTNVAKLDSANRIVADAFIRNKSTDGTLQHVRYHDEVGTEGDIFKKLLGGAIGLGLKKIILDCYGFLADDYDTGDEIYIFGFSRGAYAARALTGLIGASGIPRHSDAALFEVAWQHYRVSPTARQRPQTASAADHKTLTEYSSAAAGRAFHDTRSVKCVAVWDTVGSYGIPAGIGLLHWREILRFSH